ncbi:unnamed protein product [Lactuca virosa]|uniref:Replication protein A OB domain-containing protein n=1 Tax=Lactuca virosa TaxID=75947 RepID=A0AAU9P532_9ASTR|nr:unnamed protein product [Lactuca virosa]
MAKTMVANLNLGDGDKPIELKVIRKWLSYGEKVECCYIFLDKSGDAIEAYGYLGDKGYFDSIMRMESCYSISNYVCDNGNTFFDTVPHKTKINLDYIGRVENVYEVVRTQGNAILKLKLEKLSGTMIETTLWDEVANSFDKEAIEAFPSPVIVVVTSMKVTQYLARFADDTAEAKIVFFDGAAKMLFQTNCNTLIDHDGCTDLYTFPAPLSIVISQPKIIQFRFARFRRLGTREFVADVVFEDIVCPHKESHTQTNIINQSTASTSSKITPTSSTGPPSTAPATQQKTFRIISQHHPSHQIL